MKLNYTQWVNMFGDINTIKNVNTNIMSIKKKDGEPFNITVKSIVEYQLYYKMIYGIDNNFNIDDSEEWFKNTNYLIDINRDIISIVDVNNSVFKCAMLYKFILGDMIISNKNIDKNMTLKLFIEVADRNNIDIKDSIRKLFIKVSKNINNMTDEFMEFITSDKFINKYIINTLPKVRFDRGFVALIQNSLVAELKYYKDNYK